MKAYIRVRHSGEFYDGGCYAAFLGCEKLGIPVETYKAIYSVKGNHREDLVVGTVSDVKIALEMFGIHPQPLDYPDELRSFLGRKIWKSTLFTITRNPEYWHVFVKPYIETKRFRGTTLDKSEDLIKLGGTVDDLEVWCSEKITFCSEWRLWILNGRIMGLSSYKGQWNLYPDPKVLKEAVRAYQKAPKGYALDFGVTDEGKTLLIEVSDGYGLSHFGLEPSVYVEILKARWDELVSGKDMLPES